MAYSQKVVDKFEQTLKNPKEASVGRWKPGDKDFHRVGTGIVGAPACGDVMKLQIKCENIDGTNKTLEEAQNISNQEIVDILELPAIKIHCSVLAEEAIHRAIDDFKSRRNND
jgi:nitrogen fixation NifU-like protein